MDVDFDKVVEKLVKIKVDIKYSRKHIGKVERKIITVKEHRIVIIDTLPYSCLQAQITIHLIQFVIMWLNALPDGNVISIK